MFFSHPTARNLNLLPVGEGGAALSVRQRHRAICQLWHFVRAIYCASRRRLGSGPDQGTPDRSWREVSARGRELFPERRRLPTGRDWQATICLKLPENSGENTYTGFELEGRTQFDNGISLIAAYTYAHADITGNNDATLIGNAPSTVPRHVASLWVNYEMPETSTISGLTIGGGIRAMSNSFTSDANTSRNPGAAYFDAVICYDFGASPPDIKGLSLAVSATNLADGANRYAQMAIATPARDARSWVR